jgi:hypothetical protein
LFGEAAHGASKFDTSMKRVCSRGNLRPSNCIATRPNKENNQSTTVFRTLKNSETAHGNTEHIPSKKTDTAKLHRTKRLTTIFRQTLKKYSDSSYLFKKSDERYWLTFGDR